MTLLQAALTYAMKLMASTNYGMAYDQAVMQETITAIVETADNQDLQLIETLIKIARWESGGFRRDIASCKVRGDYGVARGLFQIHPISRQEYIDTCSKDYHDQVRAAIAHIRNSADVCRMHGYRGSDLLAIYTHGSCHRGDQAAKLRWGSGRSLEVVLYTEQNETLTKKSAETN